MVASGEKRTAVAASSALRALRALRLPHTSWRLVKVWSERAEMLKARGALAIRSASLRDVVGQHASGCTLKQCSQSTAIRTAVSEAVIAELPSRLRGTLSGSLIDVTPV